MAAFKYVMTMPSVDIGGSIAIDDLVLIGSRDSRYRELQAENPVMSQYLRAFRSPDGTLVHPSVVIRDAGLPKVHTQRLCRFRNAIAVSSVLHSRMQHYMRDELFGSGAYCTDLFDFYPISVDFDGTDLIGQTVFERSGWMPVDGFAGCTVPSVIHPQHVRVVFDQWLMIWLLNLLDMRARRRTDVEFVNRVFRSLELACHALRAPAVNLQAPGDFGAALFFWVSAFETLAHPGTGDVNRERVNLLITGVPWRRSNLRRRAYVDVTRRGRHRKATTKVSLPVQIYARLYYNRNKYAHGNPVPKGQFEFVHRKDWGKLWFQVPVLYRCTLCHVLATKGAKARPTDSDHLHDAYELALLKRSRSRGSVKR